MGESQQGETWRFFNDSAADWREKAEGTVPARVNVIKQRNDFVLSVAHASKNLSYSLDVGCGTGELVCELAKSGVHAVGVDFAEEMIALARHKAEQENLTSVDFVHTSIFDYHPPAGTFDLISANGFIEYISSAELRKFITHAKSLLKQGGSFVLGSRNRLFNVFSLNDYTAIELKHHTIDTLLSEAMLLTKAESVSEVIAQLLKRSEPLPSIAEHPRTNIDVATRHQYTPGELTRLLTDNGLTVREIFPIHFHAAGPRFAREHAEAHVQLANFMQTVADESHYLLPFASSFMLHAQLA